MVVAVVIVVGWDWMDGDGDGDGDGDEWDKKVVEMVLMVVMTVRVAWSRLTVRGRAVVAGLTKSLVQMI